MAEEKKSRAKSAMSGDGKKSKKKKAKHKRPHKVSVEHGADGGYIAEHHPMPGDSDGTAPNPKFALSDIGALHDHMDEHMGPPEPTSDAVAGMGGPDGAGPAPGGVPSPDVEKPGMPGA